MSETKTVADINITHKIEIIDLGIRRISLDELFRKNRQAHTRQVTIYYHYYFGVTEVEP